eukprot:Nitzschia sp. Nitz4//scaffold101_size76361//72884//73905//NITZ4_005618-RA/size76361-augustus-gene-0.19-mRNA-1//1//CDS//3329532206//3845//frame0
MAIGEPFESLSVARTISRTFSIWMDRSRYFTTIGLIVLAPLVISTVTVAATVVKWYLQSKTDPDFQAPSIHARVMVQCVTVLMFVLLLMANIIGEGVAAIGVARMYVGQSPTILESFKEAWSRKYVLLGSIGIILAIVCLVMLVVTVLSAGTFTGLLVFPGVYGYLGVSLIFEAIVVEGISSPTQALRRSWELASGSRCYIFCTMIVLVLIQAIFLQLCQIAVDLFGASGFVVSGLVQAVPLCCLFFPFQVILRTVVYMNLRVQRESLDLEALSNDLMKDGWSHRHQELSPIVNQNNADEDPIV